MTTEILDPVATTDVAEYRAAEAGLADLRRRLGGATWDLTTVAGNKAARAARQELVGLRTNLESKRKTIKAPVLELARRIDDEAKRITAEIIKLETPIDEQIKTDEARRAAEKAAKEAAEAKRVAAIRAKIDAIREIAGKALGKSSVVVQSAISRIEAIEVDESYAELAGEAARVFDSLLTELRGWLVSVTEQEAEARRIAAERAELEAQKKAEAERQAAEAKALAEQREREDAERRERQRIEDEARAKEVAARQAEIDAANAAAAAERAKAQAEHDAKMAAEREALEAERARQEAIRAEQERAEAKRAAEEWHATILREARIAAAENEAIDLVRELAALHPSDHERIFALHPEAVRIAANLSPESPATAG